MRVSVSSGSLRAWRPIFFSDCHSFVVRMISFSLSHCKYGSGAFWHSVVSGSRMLLWSFPLSQLIPSHFEIQHDSKTVKLLATNGTRLRLTADLPEILTYNDSSSFSSKSNFQIDSNVVKAIIVTLWCGPLQLRREQRPAVEGWFFVL